MPMHRKIGEKFGDLPFAQVARVTLPMERMNRRIQSRYASSVRKLYRRARMKVRSWSSNFGLPGKLVWDCIVSEALNQ